MAVSPARVEKGSGNNTFTLTYTAATNLVSTETEPISLEIVAPEVVYDRFK